MSESQTLRNHYIITTKNWARKLRGPLSVQNPEISILSYTESIGKKCILFFLSLLLIQAEAVPRSYQSPGSVKHKLTA